MKNKLQITVANWILKKFNLTVNDLNAREQKGIGTALGIWIFVIPTFIVGFWQMVLFIVGTLLFCLGMIFFQGQIVSCLTRKMKTNKNNK